MFLLYQVCKTIEHDDTTEMVMMVTTIAISMVDDKEQDHKNDDNDGCCERNSRGQCYDMHLLSQQEMTTGYKRIQEESYESKGTPQNSRKNSGTHQLLRLRTRDAGCLLFGFAVSAMFSRRDAWSGGGSDKRHPSSLRPTCLVRSTASTKEAPKRC